MRGTCRGCIWRRCARARGPQVGEGSWERCALKLPCAVPSHPCLQHVSCLSSLQLQHHQCSPCSQALPAQRQAAPACSTRHALQPGPCCQPTCSIHWATRVEFWPAPPAMYSTSGRAASSCTGGACKCNAVHDEQQKESADMRPHELHARSTTPTPAQEPCSSAVGTPRAPANCSLMTASGELGAWAHSAWRVPRHHACCCWRLGLTSTTCLPLFASPGTWAGASPQPGSGWRASAAMVVYTVCVRGQCLCAPVACRAQIARALLVPVATAIRPDRSLDLLTSYLARKSISTLDETSSRGLPRQRMAPSMVARCWVR